MIAMQGGVSMKNEQVTLTEIKKDVLRSILYDMFYGLGWSAAIILAAFVEWAFLPNIPLTFLSIIPFIVQEALYVIDLFLTIVGKKPKITIMTDILSDKREPKYRHFSTRLYTLLRPTRPSRIIFNYGEHYDMNYDRRFYRWSPAYAMGARLLFESSCIGDTFTIIKVRNKVRAIYNHRFFDVQYPET